jgi:2-phosphosulfolactate phosphatase
VVIRIELELRARDAGEAVARSDLIIVIDALRSGTSILNALMNDARDVIPATSLREAYRLRGQHPNYLLAGERGGLMPKGFDLGNSPVEFAREKVAGKSLVMTTTSGTEALARSQGARWVLVGAFLNARAVAERAEEIAAMEGIDVSFVLAGEKGKFSLEDWLCAGAVAESFAAGKVCLSDKAQLALLAFKQAKGNLTGNIMKAEHAQHLAEMGFKEDIYFSCKLNTLQGVPVYRDGRITVQE